MNNKVIFWGGTGQAIVNRTIIEQNGYELIAIFDDTESLRSPFKDVELYHGWEGFNAWKINKNLNKISFSVCIGNPNGDVRIKIGNKLKKLGLKPISVIHKNSIIDKTVELGEGIQIMAGAVIQPNVILKDYTIINTNSSVDHECIIHEGAEVAPGVTLCGSVVLKRNSWVCAGSTVLPRIEIGENSIIGAGSLLNKSVSKNEIHYGIPAKFVKFK